MPIIPLSAENSQSQLPGEVLARPQIIYGEGVAANVFMSPIAAAQTMRQLGISEAGIANSTVYIDPKNRWLNIGTFYANWQARLRFRSIPELREAPGDVVRLSTVVRGKTRTAVQMNRAFVHEEEHAAQAERHDINVTEGRVAMYGLAAVGALIGNRLSRHKAAAATGALLGYQLGYWLAPHERQARQRAGQVRHQPAEVVSEAIRHR